VPPLESQLIGTSRGRTKRAKGPSARPRFSLSPLAAGPLAYHEMQDDGNSPGGASDEARSGATPSAWWCYSSPSASSMEMRPGIKRARCVKSQRRVRDQDQPWPEERAGQRWSGPKDTRRSGRSSVP
jgi:hypothetical protein